MTNFNMTTGSVHRLRIGMVIAAASLVAPTPATAQSEGFGGPTQIACAPRLATSDMDTTLTLLGSQDGTTRFYYGPRDALVIGGGSERGVQVGQEFFVRRVSSGPLVLRPILETVGWVRITAVDRAAAIAQVVEMCDGIKQGDFLHPATWPDLPPIAAAGEPDYAAYGTILYAPDTRAAIATRQYAVVDLGADHGLAAGQRLTVFRAALGDLGPVTEIAQALAVLVEDDHATVRVSSARDAVQLGDRIAPHR